MKTFKKLLSLALALVMVVGALVVLPTEAKADAILKEMLDKLDKKIIALALMLKDEGKSVKVISDDYTIQNTLKIMDIAYDGIITEGIREIYNWKKVCQGCKKEFEEDYPFDDCDVCGSKVYKKRIKVSK